MNAAEDVLLRLRIDDRTLLHHATEGRLDMAAGATEAVIQIHMAEGRIEIVLKQAMDHAATNPDTFRVTGRTGHLLGDLRKIVDPLRVLFGLLRGLLLGLVGLFVLGKGGGCGAEQRGKAEGGQQG
jgi:hypothetical protein